MHYPINNVCRYVLCYISEELTSEPGLYMLNLYEFNIFNKVFTSFRLANADEIMSATDKNVKIDVIRISQDKLTQTQTQANLTGVLFINTRFFTHDTPQNSIDNNIEFVTKIKNDMLKNYSTLIESDTSASFATLKELLPGIPDEEAKRLANALIYVKQIADANINISKEELVEMFLSKYRDTNDINLPD